MCDDSSTNSNIELNINIKVPYGTQPPKVISSDHFPSPTKIIIPQNENNSSLILHNATNIEPSSSYYTPSSQNIAPSPIYTPSSQNIAPSPISTPSSQHIAPSPISTPSSQHIAPSPSSLTEKNAPSPITTPSSEKNTNNNNKIIDDTINPSIKTPSPSLRGLNITQKNMNEAQEENSKKNEKDTDVAKETNIGVIITISVLSTLLVIMIIGGLVYKFKLKKSKVNSERKIEHVEVDAREFRRKFEEAKKLHGKKPLPENKKLVLKHKKTINVSKSTDKQHKIPEVNKKPKKLPPPPIRKNRIITETPPPGMGFKKGDTKPDPNNKGNIPSTPKNDN